MTAAHGLPPMAVGPRPSRDCRTTIAPIVVGPEALEEVNKSKVLQGG